ncbi:MAG: ABC-2 family transporter protein [Candidatus Hadarchaeum sp.]
MRRYFGYLRIAFLRGMIYRTSIYLSVINVGLLVLIQYYLWTTVFEKRSSVGNYSFQSLLTYVLIARVLSAFLQVNVDTEIGNRIRKGDIATDLIRPVDLQVSTFLESLGTSLTGLFLVTIPAFMILLGLGLVRLPHDLLAFISFSMSVTLAYALLFSVSYVFGLLAFWTKTGWGLSDVKDALLLFFSGSFLPVELYPTWLRTIAEILPFRSIIDTPMRLYMGGMEPRVVLGLLLQQLVWTIFLLGLGRLLWNAAMRRLEVYGG